MRPPSVLFILEGFGGTCGLEQGIAQPRCIAPLKIEGLAEYPGLVAASQMGLGKAVGAQLGNVDNYPTERLSQVAAMAGAGPASRRWQAACWPGRISRISGSSFEQRAKA